MARKATPTPQRGVAIEAGARIAYSRAFLQSIAAYTGRTPFARGVVEAIEACGHVNLACIRWDDGHTSAALTSNLVREDRLHLEAA